MKKKIIAIALAAVLAIIAVAGASLAYFSDSDKSTNTIKMGNENGIGVDVQIDETPVIYDEETHTWIPDPDGERVDGNVYGDDYGVYPGAFLPKDPTAHNEGATDLWLRVKVASDNKDFISLFGKDAALTDAKKLTNEMVSNLFDGYDPTLWDFAVETTKIDKTTNNYTLVFTCKEPLAVGDSITIFTGVKLPTWMTMDDTANGKFFQTMKEDGIFDIDITTEAVQYDGFDNAAAAFAAAF